MIRCALLALLAVAGCAEEDAHPDVPRFPRLRGDPRVEIVSMAGDGERFLEVLHDGDATLLTLSERSHAEYEPTTAVIIRVYEKGELRDTHRIEQSFGPCSFAAERAPGGTYEVNCDSVTRHGASVYRVIRFAPPYGKAVLDPNEHWGSPAPVGYVPTPEPPDLRGESSEPENERWTMSNRQAERELWAMEHPASPEYTYVDSEPRVLMFDSADVDWYSGRAILPTYFAMRYYRATLLGHVIEYKTFSRNIYETVHFVGPLPGDAGIWLVLEDTENELAVTNTLFRIRLKR